MMDNFQKNLWRERASLGDRGVLDPADKKGLKNKYIDLTHKIILEEEMKLSTSDKVLDFGCGAGRLSSWIANFEVSKVIGVDITPEMIDRAQENYSSKKNLKFLNYNGSKIPSSDDYFDKVLSVWVLQHIVEESKFRETIRELGRVLKKNGQIFFIEQVMQRNSSEKYPQTDYIYKLQRSPKNYIKTFQESGFRLIEWYPVNTGRGIFYKFIVIGLPFFLSFLTPLFVRIDLFLTRWMKVSKDKYTDSFFIFKKV